MRRSLRPSTLVPLAILTLLPALLLFPALFLGQALLPAHLLSDIAPWRKDWQHTPVPWDVLPWDGIAQFYTWRSFTATSLHQGYLPLWNPHQFTGTPFVANAQSAVFYPLNILFTIMPVWAAFGVSAWLHLALTGCFMCLMLRRAGNRSIPAAVLGGIVWQLSTWQVAWLALPTFLCVSTWLPLAMLLTHKTVTKPSALRSAGLGACLGVMLLAGHFQIWIYCFLLCAAYAMTLLVSMRETWLRDRKAAAGVWGAVALALLVIVAIGSAQLLPSLELSRMSHRAASGAPTMDGYHGYLHLATLPFALITLIQPEFFGSPGQGTYALPTPYAENACYLGVLGLLLAVVGLFSIRKDSGARFFAVAACVALLVAVGSPLAGLLYFGIPGFTQTGSPGRILVLWSFCGAGLAAAGLDRIITAGAASALREAGKALGIVAVIVALCLADLALWLQKNAAPGSFETILASAADLWRLPVCILFVAGLALAAYRSGKMKQNAVVGLLVCVCGADLLISGMGTNRTVKPEEVYPITPAITFLQQHASDGRIMPVNKRWSMSAAHPPQAVLPPNAATVYGLSDVQGYDSLFPGQYMAFAAALNADGRSPAPDENGNMVFVRGIGSDRARQAAARYVVTLGGLDTVPEGLRFAMQDGPVSVYEDTQALPRFSDAAGQAIPGADEGPNEMALTPASGSAAVIVRDQWYPGWKATVDGKPAPITEAPYIFRTVALPPAHNKPAIVRMEFSPASIQVGLYAMCIGLATLTAIVAATLRRYNFRRL